MAVTLRRRISDLERVAELTEAIDRMSVAVIASRPPPPPAPPPRSPRHLRTVNGRGRP